MREAFRLRMIQVKSLLRSYIQLSLLCYMEIAYIIVSNCCAVIVIMSKHFERSAIKTIEAILCPRPDKAHFILYTAHDGIVRQTILHLVMTEIVILLAQ